MMAAQERDHQDWFEFLRKVAELPSGYAIDDLRRFQRIAERQYPELVPVIKAYIYLVQLSYAEMPKPQSPGKPPEKRRKKVDERPLFDLFRDRGFFSTNSELVKFALGVAPDMKHYRFDKMSRGAIAFKLVEHLEKLPNHTRARLEISMREAMDAAPDKSEDRQIYVSKWERIIKGLAI